MLSKCGNRTTLPIIVGVSEASGAVEFALGRGTRARDEYGDISSENARAHLEVLFLKRLTSRVIVFGYFFPRCSTVVGVPMFVV